MEQFHFFFQPGVSVSFNYVSMDCLVHFSPGAVPTQPINWSGFQAELRRLPVNLSEFLVNLIGF